MLVSLCPIGGHDVVYTAINRYFTFLLNVSALKSKLSRIPALYKIKFGWIFVVSLERLM